ncbi:hypothetical protein PV325_013358 [Microctonus aethiopoides]|nr:hypothetical protein PV325_013358 [Microctonus aethiopoides]
MKENNKEKKMDENAMETSQSKVKRGITESEFDEAAKELSKKVLDDEGWEEVQSTKRLRKNNETIIIEKEKQKGQQTPSSARDEQRGRDDPTKADENDRSQKENIDVKGKKLTKEIFMNIEGKLMKIDTLELMSRAEDQKVRYEEKDIRPRNIIIKINREFMNVKKEKNNIKIWKTLMRYNIIPKEVKMISHGTAIGTFDNYRDANRCLEELEKEKEIQASTDSKRTTCKGVIADWPDSIPELWEALEDQNSIVKLERIYNRKWVVEKKRMTEIKTENIIATFKGDKIKENIKLWNDRVRLKICEAELVAKITK